jgi:hypothetical protein
MNGINHTNLPLLIVADKSPKPIELFHNVTLLNRRVRRTRKFRSSQPMLATSWWQRRSLEQEHDWTLRLDTHHEYNVLNQERIRGRVEIGLNAVSGKVRAEPKLTTLGPATDPVDR